ncbi:MAG: amino acid permease, partial [Halorientalis sp.]
ETSQRTAVTATNPRRNKALQDEDPLVEVLTVTEIPEQTPYETAIEAAEGRTKRIQKSLAAADLDADYTVAGHICQDVAFDIVQTARDGGADLIVMGYPQQHTHVAEGVEYDAPCGVLFASGLADSTDFDVVNVGAGGGPHHLGLLPVIERMGQHGIAINVINVAPQGGGGRAETPDATLAGLAGAPEVHVQNLTAPTVADGLVETAAENGGILVIGATRTRRLRRWVFGSTPDRVITSADAAGVPVLVYADPRGIHGLVEDYIYPLYRRLVGREPGRTTETNARADR